MTVDWIDDFFNGYAETFRSKSRGERLTKFSLPLTFLTASGPIAIGDEERLSANFDALMRRYERVGVVDWHHSVREIRALGEGIHLAELEWRFLDGNNEQIYACETSYILAGEGASSARVMAIIAHNENEEYEKALSRKTGV